MSVAQHELVDRVEGSHLVSTLAVPVEERLIVALDVPTYEDARAIIERLGDSVRFYKIGLELLLAGNYLKLVEDIREGGSKVFVDLKIFEIPETVRRAVSQLKSVGASFVTVHGNDTMLEAAVDAKNGNLKVLAVTVLTSLDRSDIRELGFQDVTVEELVLSRTRKALRLGCDGVIASGKEAAAIRQEHDGQLLIVTPGIRPIDNDRDDDQKRTVTAREAFENGADYIVVGRQIRDAKDPRSEALKIQEEIRSVVQ